MAQDTAGEGLYRLEIGAFLRSFGAQSLSFWLVSAYLFFEYVRPQSIYPAIDVLPWAQTVIILALVVRLLDKEPFGLGNVQTFLLGLFISVVLLSWQLNPPSWNSEERVITHVSWGIIYFLIVATVNTEKRLFMSLLLFLLWNFKMSQHGTFSWARRGFGFADWGVAGAPGWFSNSGEFGIAMCIFLPLSIYFAVALQSRWVLWKRILIWSFPATALATIMATNSRGAMLAAAVVLLWMAMRHGRRLSVALLIIAVGVAGYQMVPDQSLQRFETAGEDSTSTTRIIRWNAGLDIMGENPVLGIGPANWDSYYQTHYPREPGAEGWGLPHNIFIDAGAEFGVTGLSLYVAMILYCFVLNRRTRRMAERNGNRFLFYMAHAMDAALIGFLVSGSFVSVLFYPYFWIHASFTVALYKVAGLPESARQTRERPAPQFAPGLRGGADAGSPRFIERPDGEVQQRSHVLRQAGSSSFVETKG